MSDNVWEWVQDWYGENYYQNSPINNPSGPSYGSYRVNRGGSWDYDASYFRSSHRDGNEPTYSSGHLGFRLVR